MAEEGMGARVKVAERKQDPGEMGTRGEVEKMRETGRRERDEDKGEAGLYICGGMWSFLKVRGGPVLSPLRTPLDFGPPPRGSAARPRDPGPPPRGILAATRRVEKAGYIRVLHLIWPSGADW